MIKAVGFRVVILPDAVKERSQSGIILAVDKRMEASATISGKVVDIGPDAFKAFNPVEPWCQVGDHVYYAKYAGKWLTDYGTNTDYLVVNDEDIVAKDE